MPIAKHNTQAHAAYQEIKRRIVSGFFTASDRLRETEVAAVIEMGRTPVREALKRLEDEGLLTHLPHRGLVVTPMDQQAVTELYSMREVLEGAAASFAAKHATVAEIANMEAILDESNEHTDPVVLNRAFHQAIHGAAHNRHLIRSLSSTADWIHLLGPSTFSVKERIDAAQIEHRALLEAIRSANSTLASELAREHVRNALLVRLKMLRQDQAEPALPPEKRAPRKGAVH